MLAALTSTSDTWFVVVFVFVCCFCLFVVCCLLFVVAVIVVDGVVGGGVAVALVCFRHTCFFICFLLFAVFFGSGKNELCC